MISDEITLQLVVPVLGLTAADLPARLDPSRLDPLAISAVQALKAEGESENTVRSYRSAARYWAAWFSLRYGIAIKLPVHSSTILQFIVDHVERKTKTGLTHELPTLVDEALVEGGFKGALGPLALATTVHRISVLSKLHQVRSLPNPCQDLTVRELMTSTRKAYAKRGVVQKKKGRTQR